jgi:hypothetical protein
MAARASDLRLYLDYNPDHAKFNGVSGYGTKAEPLADDIQSSTRIPTMRRS